MKTSVFLSKLGVAVFSFLTFLAALPYELGEVATIIPPEWKARLAVTSAIAALLLRVLNGQKSAAQSEHLPK